MRVIYHSLIFTMAFSASAVAQSIPDAYRKRMMDSIKRVYAMEAAIRNPLLRQAVISSTIVGNGQIRSKLYGSNLMEGNFSQVRTEGLITVPVKSWGRNGISASVSYLNQQIHLSDVKTFNPDWHLKNSTTVAKNTLGLSASYKRVDSLWGHMFLSTATVSLFTGDAGEIQKVAGMAIGMMVLKATKTTQLTVGGLVLIDPTTNIPFVPLVFYTHRFNNDLELNAYLPQQVILRKGFSKRCWGTFGTSLSSSLSFFTFSSPQIPRDVNFSSLDIKTGPGVEYRLNKLLIVGLNGGLWTPVQSRQYDRGKSTNDYFLNNKIDTAPFVNLSLSLLPFLGK